MRTFESQNSKARVEPIYRVVHSRPGKSSRVIYDSRKGGDPASFVDASRRVAETRYAFGFPGGTMTLYVDGVKKKEWHCSKQTQKATPPKQKVVIDLSYSPPKKKKSTPIVASAVRADDAKHKSSPPSLLGNCSATTTPKGQYPATPSKAQKQPQRVVVKKEKSRSPQKSAQKTKLPSPARKTSPSPKHSVAREPAVVHHSQAPRSNEKLRDSSVKTPQEPKVLPEHASGPKIPHSCPKQTLSQPAKQKSPGSNKKKRTSSEKPRSESAATMPKEIHHGNSKEDLATSPKKRDRLQQQPAEIRREPKGKDGKRSPRALTERLERSDCEDDNSKSKIDSGIIEATSVSRRQDGQTVTARTPQRAKHDETARDGPQTHSPNGESGYAMNELVFVLDSGSVSGREGKKVARILAANDDGSFDVKPEKGGRRQRVVKSRLSRFERKRGRSEAATGPENEDRVIAMSPPKKSSPTRRTVTTSKSPQNSAAKRKRRLGAIETPVAKSPSPKRRAVTASKKEAAVSREEEASAKKKKRQNVGEFVTGDDFVDLPPVDKKRRPCPPHVANTIVHLIRDDADHGMTASVIEGQLASATGPVLPRPKLAQAAWNKLLETTDARAADSARRVVDLCFKTISPGRADTQEPWLPVDDLKQQSLVDTMCELVSHTNGLSCLDALVFGLKDVCPRSKLASRLADGRLAEAFLERFNESHARGDACCDEKIVVLRALAFLATLDRGEHIVRRAKETKCDIAALCNGLAVAIALNHDQNVASPLLTRMIKSLGAASKKKAARIDGLAKRTLALENMTPIAKPKSPLDELVNCIIAGAA